MLRWRAMIVNRMFNLRWFFSCCFLVSVSSLVLSAETAYDSEGAVLKRLHSMIKAIKETEYSGRFVYQHGQYLDLLEISHQPGKEGVEKIHLKALTGDATEIIHDGSAVICVYPDAHASSVALNAIPKGLSPLLPETLDHLSGLYQLTHSGEDRLVGRMVDVFSLLPLDKYRYGMRFYVDRISALPLKIDKFDHYGRNLSQIMFTDISFEVPAGFGPVINHTDDKRFVVMDRKDGTEEHVDHSLWVLKDLPPGYHEINRRLIHRKKFDTEHIVLGDGLSSMSVYIEASEKDNRLDGFASIGAVKAYGKRYGDTQVTAIGEVPSSAVALVVNGLKRQMSIP